MSPLELALVLASALLHAGWSARIKSSTEPLVFNALQSGTTLMIAALALPWIHWDEIALPVWRWLAVTVVAHVAYIYWLSRALELGDLTLVYPIARSTPALLPLVAVPFFGERLSATGGLGIAIVVGGIWLVHAGPALRLGAFASPGARHAWLTLLATVCYGIADKEAMTALATGPWTSPVPQAIAFYALLAGACSALFTPIVIARRGWDAFAGSARRELGAATVASAVSFVGYTLVLKALETAPASYVVSVRQSSVLFALVLGVSVLGEAPSRPRVLGALATVAGVALIALGGG